MEKPVNSINTDHRKSGILVHPTSFPGPYGIGDLGDSAFRFIDFLIDSDQELWQVLPIGPTGYGDSPYQAFSSFAGQPLIISPDKLIKMGLLNTDELALQVWNPEVIDYGPAIKYKTNLLQKAFANFNKSNNKSTHKQFKNFCIKHKDWLANYALFMAVKDFHDGVMWTEWEKEIAFPSQAAINKWNRKLEVEIKYYKFIQFIFFKQWFELKKYANDRGISIIGDIPIFVAFDSSDVWANKDLFFLDSKGYPTIVAGVPPDYFSETGQLWGNPLYDWTANKKTNYNWWIKRISSNLEFVDFLRIDHFRGFEAYWSIPYGAKTAIDGEWKTGPGHDIFIALEAELGKNLPIIAEDLGVITPEVEALRDDFNFPGMKILQFAFENIEENNFLPHNYTPNSICYTGTHDNDTTLGWYLKAISKSQDRVRRYMNTDANDVCWDFIRTCFGSVSTMAVVPLQDIFSYDSWARTNTPGVAANNWKWRFKDNMLNEHYIGKLRYVTKLFGRGRSTEDTL